MDPRTMNLLYVVTFAALAFGGFAYATVGFGSALVASPFLIATLGAADGVRVSLMLGTLLGLIALPGARLRVRKLEGSLMLAPALALSSVFAAIVRGSDGALLMTIAGALTLLSIAALAARHRSTHLGGRAGAVGAGVMSAGMNVVAGIGGPPLALYTVNAGWSPDEARSTMQTVFLFQNVVALASLGLAHVPTAFFFALPLGWGTGTLAARHLPGGALRSLALIVAGIGGALAIGRGLTL
jgi:hypothetical protein